MAVSNFTEIKSAVANWLHRTDLTANIPEFIELAEWRLARDLRISPMIVSSSVTVAAAGSTGTLPTGMMEIANVRISSGAELHFVPIDTIDRVTGSGVPWAYSIQGSSVLVSPSWTAGGTLTMMHYQKPTALSDTALTNAFTTYCPDALLYGALMEAAPYLIDDTRIAIWKGYYETAVDRINEQYSNVDAHARMIQRQATPSRQPKA